MKSTQEKATGTQTVYKVPASPLSKFVKVNNALVVLTAQDEASVTLASAPVANATVDVYFGADIVIPPLARTATGTGPVIPAPSVDKGLTLFLNVSAASGTSPTLDCKVQQLDVISGGWFDVAGASFPQVATTVNLALTIFPGAASQANVSVNGTIRNQFRVAYAIGGTTPSFTFSIGAQA